MSTFEAVQIIEGDCEATDLQNLEAWATLIATGLVWQLQGFYGRTAVNMIEAGVISRSGKILNPNL